MKNGAVDDEGRGPGGNEALMNRNSGTSAGTLRAFNFSSVAQ